MEVIVKYRASKKIVDECIQYNEILTSIIDNSSADELKFISDLITDIKHRKILNVSASTPEEVLDNKSTNDLFKLYMELSTYYNALHILIESFQTHNLQPETVFSSDMSDTYKSGATKMLKDLMYDYKKFNKLFEDVDENLLKLYTDKCAADTLDNIEKAFEKYPSVELLVSVIQKLYLSADAEMEQKLNQLVDNRLTKVIDYALEAPKKSFIHLENPPIDKFNMLPITNLMPLADIVKVAFNTEYKDIWSKSEEQRSNYRSDNRQHNGHQHNGHHHNKHYNAHHHNNHQRQHNGHQHAHKGGAEQSLKQIAHDNNCCIIVSSKITSHPTEHNITKLISYDAAKNYMQSQQAGVTKNMVERFRTINVGEDADWHFMYDIYNARIENEKVTHCVVFETLDGNTYRILGAPNVTSFKIPKDTPSVAKLIAYITQPISNSRSSLYHHLCTIDALKNMFLSKELNVEELVDESKVNAFEVKNKVINALNDKIKDLAKDLSTDAAIIKVLHSHELQHICVEVIMEGYDWFGAETDMTFPISELMSSFMVDLLIMAKRLMKELHDTFTGDKLRANDKAKTLENLFAAVKKSVDLIFPDDTNIYQSIRKKYLLLTFK